MSNTNSTSALQIPGSVSIKEVQKFGGVTCLVVECPDDFDSFKALPDALHFDGLVCGKSGYNSEWHVGYFRSDVRVAVEYEELPFRRLPDGRTAMSGNGYVRMLEALVISLLDEREDNPGHDNPIRGTDPTHAPTCGFTCDPSSVRKLIDLQREARAAK